jgi:hypothetical protein
MKESTGATNPIMVMRKQLKTAHSVHWAASRLTHRASGHELKCRTKFKYDGGGIGKGGALTLSANGSQLAGGRLERTVPQKFSICEGLDIGMDVGPPVDFTYKPPFAFTAKIEKVAVELK